MFVTFQWQVTLGVQLKAVDNRTDEPHDILPYYEVLEEIALLWELLVKRGLICNSCEKKTIWQR